jgi:hypothetical protein
MLQNIAEPFGIEISSENSETMVFLDKIQRFVKSLSITNFLQQVNNFKYLCCEIACENENGIQQQPEKFLKCWEF